MLYVMWFRRDLRLADNPALLSALAAADAAGADGILPLYIVDPTLVGRCGRPQLAYLAASLRSLSSALGSLHVRVGEPARVLAELGQTHPGMQVHQCAEFTPYARQRSTQVAEALQDRGTLLTTGSPYAVDPGQAVKADGTRYLVFTPYYRAWLAHGWHAPASAPALLPVVTLAGSAGLPSWDYPDGISPRPAGEAAAADRWEAFQQDGLADYAQYRDRPDRDSTSLMSVPLRFGEVHPRTLLADLSKVLADSAQEARHAGARSLMREIAWREFFADILDNRPDTVTESLNPSFDAMVHDEGPQAQEALEAWKSGRTGYPLVDAGMRELAATGLMHNRVRLVVASFLVKDLHLPWWLGASHFMDLLIDGDVASNTHNWQWVAGCGADAAPYYRVFNPVLQGLKFDPDGIYVRRHVPELRHLTGPAVQTPWQVSDGYAHGYPQRIVDHAQERDEALLRYQALRDSASAASGSASAASGSDPFGKR